MLRLPLLALFATVALCAACPAVSAQDGTSAGLEPAAGNAGEQKGHGPVLAPSPGSAQPSENSTAPVGTLSEALKLAYWTNPNLLAQRAHLRASDYLLPQARAGYGPKLGVSGSYGYERDKFEVSTGGYVPKADWTATAAAVITQPLYSFGRNAAAERNANASISFSRSTLRATEAKVLLNTIVAYSVLARDKAGVGISQDNLALLEREYADTATRLQARETTSTDFQQVESRVGLGRAQLYVAQERLATSRAEFLRVVGALPGDLAPPNPLNLPVTSLEEAYAFAERSSPVLAAAYAREKVSRAALDAARADMMPRIDLNGRAESGTITPYSSDLRQTTLRGELVVTAPIFESGLRRARVDEAREANEADWRLIEAALRDSRAEVAAAWNTMVAQHAATTQLRAAVDAAERAYDGAVLQERAGMRTTLDVLDLARELLLARTGLNNAITEAYVAEARLLSAMGTLEGFYLLPDEALYDPETNYADARDNGDVPLLTPLIRALDGIGHAGEPADRPIRDPAGPLTTPGASIGSGMESPSPPARNEMTSPSP